jgi:hypothetical protein
MMYIVPKNAYFGSSIKTGQDLGQERACKTKNRENQEKKETTSSVKERGERWRGRERKREERGDSKVKKGK